MRTIAVLSILAAGVIAASCGGDSVMSPSGSGRLSLMIKDTSHSDAKALLVTFSEVTAHGLGRAVFPGCRLAAQPPRRTRT